MQTMRESEEDTQGQSVPVENKTYAIYRSNVTPDTSEALLKPKPELDALGWTARSERLRRLTA